MAAKAPAGFQFDGERELVNEEARVPDEGEPTGRIHALKNCVISSAARRGAPGRRSDE